LLQILTFSQILHNLMNDCVREMGALFI